MCLCVGCTHILLLLFLSHSSVCHLLSGVHHSDFTVRCSNFSRSKYATSPEHTDIEREGVRKRASARVCPHRAMEWKGATNRLTHTRIHTKRFTTIRASTSWTLFRNACSEIVMIHSADYAFRRIPAMTTTTAATTTTVTTTILTTRAWFDCTSLSTDNTIIVT